MPEVKSPDMERVRKRVLDAYRNGRKPKELSVQFGISVNTIKSWIKRYGSASKEGAKKGASSAPGKPGAPKGNRNAVGNSGGSGGPPGNKKNFRHGAYEKVMGDLLEEDEATIFNDGDTGLDVETELRQTLAALNAKEVRLVKRINQIHEQAAKSRSNMISFSASKSVVKREAGAFNIDENGQWKEQVRSQKAEDEGYAVGERESVTSSHTISVFEALGKLEAELDKVQGRKIKVLGDLEKIRVERERLELERKRLEGQTEQSKLAQAWIAALTGEDIEDAEDED